MSKEIEELLSSTNIDDVVLGVILGLERNEFDFSSENWCRLEVPIKLDLELSSIIYNNRIHIISGGCIIRYPKGDRTNFPQLYNDGTVNL